MDRIQEIIGALNSTPGIKGCLVVDNDGFIIAHSIPSTLNVDEAAAISSQVHGVLKNCACGLKLGDIGEVLIEGSEGTTLLRKAEGVVMAAILSKDANLGYARMEARKAAEKICEALALPSPVDKVHLEARAEAAEKQPYPDYSLKEKLRKNIVEFEEDKMHVIPVAPPPSKPKEPLRFREVLLHEKMDLVEASVSSEDSPLTGPPAAEVIIVGDRVRFASIDDSGTVERLKGTEALIRWDISGPAWLELGNMQAVLVQEKSMNEPPREEENVVESRENILKKFRLKDPDKGLIDDIVSGVVKQPPHEDKGGVDAPKKEADHHGEGKK